MGNRVRVKSSGMAPGAGKCPAPGQCKICKCPTPELTRRANAPQLPVGGLGAGGID